MCRERDCVSGPVVAHEILSREIESKDETQTTKAYDLRSIDMRSQVTRGYKIYYTRDSGEPAQTGLSHADRAPAPDSRSVGAYTPL